RMPGDYPTAASVSSPCHMGSGQASASASASASVPVSVFSISVPVSAPCRRGCRRSQARRVQRGSSSDFSLVLLFVPCGALFLFATSALYDPRRRLQARLPPRIRELAAHDRVEDAPREGLA